MWDFLKAVLENYGFVALVQVAQAGAIIYLYKTNQKKQSEIVDLQEKRIEDVKESKDHYEELARNLDKSIDLLIEVFKRNGG
jgi:hypothetical protein